MTVPENLTDIEGALNYLLKVIDKGEQEPLGVVVTIVRERGVSELQEVHTILRRGRADAHVELLERSVEALKDLIEMRKKSGKS